MNERVEGICSVKAMEGGSKDRVQDRCDGGEIDVIRCRIHVVEKGLM